MWVAAICLGLTCLGLTRRAVAHERSGLIHKASCAVVRFYVAKYSATAAEIWARSHGATDTEIEEAWHCLDGLSARTAQAFRSTAQ